MGRQRLYATEEEAKEAKKAQMRAAYERRKAAKTNPPSPTPTAPNHIVEEPATITPEPVKRTRKLKISEKAQLWDEIQKMVTGSTQSD